MKSALIIFAWHHVLPLLAPFKKGWSTPKRAARVAARLLQSLAA